MGNVSVSMLSVRTIRFRREDGARGSLRSLKYATAAVRREAERLVSDCEVESASSGRHPAGMRRYVTVEGVCYVIEAKWRY